MTIVSFSKGTGALNTISQIQKSEGLRTTSISKISSSLKIRKASDAVADSAIGTKLKVEVESLKQLLIGTAQAKAALDIAEGGLGEVTKTLTRMNTLAMSAKNGVYKKEEIEKINQEFVALIDEIDRIAKATNFNSKQLLSGTETVVKDHFDSTHLGEDLRDGNLSSEEQGFESITIDNSKSNTGYIVSYDQQTRLLRVTNINDRTQYDETKVSSDKIKEGTLETVILSKLGVTIKLNHNFNKDRSIGTTYDHMMNPSLNNDNLTNIGLVNTINSNFLEKEPDIPTLAKFNSTMDVTNQFRIAGEPDLLILPTNTVDTLEVADTVEAAHLLALKNAFELAMPTASVGDPTVVEMDTTRALSSGTLNEKELELLNDKTGTQTLNITSVSWNGAFTSGADYTGTTAITAATILTDAYLRFTPYDTTDADSQTATNFQSFKVTGFDHTTGTVSFELTTKVDIVTTTAGGTPATPKAETVAAFNTATVTGTFQLDKGTYTDGFKPIDLATQSVVKDADTGAAIVLKGGTYQLTDNDVVARDGFVYDKRTGDTVKTLKDDPNSTVQLKLNSEMRTDDISIATLQNDVTDLSSFDVKIKGTNGKAILYIEAQNGTLQSEELNLTDIVFNDGYDGENYANENDNSSYIAKTKLTRGRVKLSRIITNGQREDAIIIDLNKLRTDGLIKAPKITVKANNGDVIDLKNVVNASNKAAIENLIRSEQRAFSNLAAGVGTDEIVIQLTETIANITGTTATTIAKDNATSVFQTLPRDAGFNNDVFLTLNELKNTVVAFQKTSDKTNLSFQVGTGSGDQNSVKVTIDSITSARLNLINPSTGKKLQLSDDLDSLQDIISIVQSAIDVVQTVRSEVAVGDNRLNIADSSIQTSITNSQAAVSAIFDLDIPEEMVELSQSEMMEQSSIEALAKEMRAKQNLMKLF